MCKYFVTVDNDWRDVAKATGTVDCVKLCETYFVCKFLVSAHYQQWRRQDFEPKRGHGVRVPETRQKSQKYSKLQIYANINCQIGVHAKAPWACPSVP